MSSGSLFSRPVLTPFVVWFAHFMLCWAAVEIWPDSWIANQLAWGLTLIALMVMGGHFVNVKRRAERGELADITLGWAHGAMAIATAAVVFTALPSVTLMP